MDLEDELRRMFANADDRLDVPVRPDAGRRIVAGARRMRRRRIVATTIGGTAAVVAIVGGVALAGSQQEAMPPATKETVTSSPAPGNATLTSGPTGGLAVPSATGNVTTKQTTSEVEQTQQEAAGFPPPTATGEQIGPLSWRGLRLGMTYEEAISSGLVRAGSPPGGRCTRYELVGPNGSGVLVVSGDNQVVTLSPVDPRHTPEGVAVGWTVAQAKAVYPEIDEALVATTPGHQLIAVSGNPRAHYRLSFDGGVLRSISLEAVRHSCVT